MTTEVHDTGHEYDGIREHDNKLPRWWLFTLYGAIVFAFGYWLYYQTFGVGLGPRAQFNEDYKEMQAQLAVHEEAEARKLTDDALMKMTEDPAVVASGKAVYMANCLACHADKGQGLVGPNMTDAYWIHGSKPLENIKIINDGVATKGMPSWKPVLGAQKIKEVEVYLLTLRGKNEVGKPAEGLDANGQPPPTTPPPTTPPATPPG